MFSEKCPGYRKELFKKKYGKSARKERVQQSGSGRMHSRRESQT